MLRDAQALMAFQDGTTWEEAVETVAGETSSAISPGVAAAGAYIPVESLSAEPTAAEVVYYVQDGALVLAARSPSSRICVGSATESASVDPECIPPVTPTTAVRSTLAAVLSGEVLSLPAGVTPLQLDTVPPAVPSGLVAAPGSSRLTLSWAAVSDAVSYKVFVGGAAAPAATVSTNSAVLTPLQNGVSYSVAISAVDRAGNESARSAAVSAAPALTISSTLQVGPVTGYNSAASTGPAYSPAQTVRLTAGQQLAQVSVIPFSSVRLRGYVEVFSGGPPSVGASLGRVDFDRNVTRVAWTTFDLSPITIPSTGTYTVVVYGVDNATPLAAQFPSSYAEGEMWRFNGSTGGRFEAVNSLDLVLRLGFAG